MKQFIALAVFSGLAAPAHAISIVSLHGAVLSFLPGSEQVGSFGLVVAVGVLGLVVAFRVLKRRTGS